MSPVRVVLLAGPSGSGKSYLARRCGLPVIALDDFYRDADDPAVSRRDGAVDWESPTSWHADDAAAAVIALATHRRAEVPVYALGADRRIGVRQVDLDDAPAFVAEGIFAAEIVAACRRAGVLADAVVLTRPRTVTLLRRLARDLAEARKPWPVLLRRGWALLRAERAVVARQVAAGCRPCSAPELLRTLNRWAAAEPARPAPALVLGAPGAAPG